MVDDVVRPLGGEDLPQSAAVLREAFADVAAEFGLTPQNAPGNGAFATAGDLAAERSAGCLMYGMFHRGGQTGFVSLRPGDHAVHELRRLAVRPPFRHAGRGGRLLDFAKAEARRLGARRLALGLIEENGRLRAWYLAHGFVHAGTERRPGFPFTVGRMEFPLDDQPRAP